MHTRHLAPFAWVLSFSIAVNSLSVQRATCIPASSETGDDSPAIQAALAECGNGGTILIPSANTYRIDTSIDFSTCHGCVVQIDGTLDISTTFKWNESVLQFTGAEDVTINGIAGTFKRRGDSQGEGTSLNITNASNIKLLGLHIDDPRRRGVHISNSTNIDIASLSLNGTYQAMVISQSSQLRISDINISRSTECVSIGRRVFDVQVEKVSCTNVHTGIIVDTQFDADSPVTNVHNITFSDLEISGSAQWATGIAAMRGRVNVTDVSWKNVRLDGVTSPISIISCWGGSSTCGINQDQGARFNLERITFENFSGTAKHPNPPTGCGPYAYEGGVCEVAVRNYTVEGLS